jgi:hypothetical protein
VHDRLRRVPGERVGQPRLAQAAGADDGHHPRAGHQGPQPRQVVVPADQLGRLVAHPAADRAVERQQAPVRALQQLAGIRAEPVAQVPPVPLEALERHRRAAERRLAAQQIGSSVAANRTSLTGRKRRQQRTRTLPDNGHPPPADVIQKRKHDPHVVSLRSAHGQPASTPPPRRPASEVHLQTPISRLSD